MSRHNDPKPMIVRPSGALKGTATIPGDKSVSHRALILGALCIGKTHIHGLLEGQDVLDTAQAMRQFGADVSKQNDGSWIVQGVGVGGFFEPDDVIDCGNSGTGVRLIMGAMATTPITALFTGDASLRSRPMNRVIKPLALFGAQAFGREGGKLPLAFRGAEEAGPVEYALPMASAQVKSAMLLAGLNAGGETIIIEPKRTRDHTELMLKGFGVELDISEQEDGSRKIYLSGRPELEPQSIDVPRDPSSAAFPIVAALLCEGSNVLVPNISLNPTRTGLYETLLEMGAKLSYENQRETGGEPVADIRAEFSPELKAVDVPANRAASMIDEYPVLSVVAAFAKGITRMNGVSELRVKESDRIAAMETGLGAMGITVQSGPDWMQVEGIGHGNIAGGATVSSVLDHRIAMSFACLGMAANAPITIDDASPIETSFPNFFELMRHLGGELQLAEKAEAAF